MGIDVAELITQRRRQLYVHSVMYYRLCDAIITDATFDRWAYELAELQRDYPSEASSCPFADEFSGWDGTTGFHLPYSAWAIRKATELLEYARDRR